MATSFENTEEILGYCRAILDTVADGIICIDSDGIVTTFNRSAEEMFGYAAEEVLGEKINLLMPASFAAQHDRYMSTYETTGEAKLIGTRPEVKGKRKSGELFPIEIGLTEASHQGKKIFVGVVRDITERKRVERIKSEFIATVSHELRTPLTSIYGPLALMHGGKLGPLPAPVTKTTEIALRNCERLSTLINDLLDFEKLSSGKATFAREVQNVAALVQEAAQDNEGYAVSCGARLSLHCADDDTDIVADKSRVLQVLTNLVSNALKFSDEGGTVDIRAVRTGDTVRISVIDRGIGIAAEHHDRIFQRFSQVDASAKRKVGGTGLGLAISKEMTEKMGGRIGFASEAGKGSTFWIEFPVHRDEAVAPPGPRSGPHAAIHQTVQ